MDTKIFKSTKKFAIITLIIFCVMSISFINFVFALQQAGAIANSEDKLYGEGLSQRNMSIKDCPNISAQYAILTDKNGNIIYERNAYESSKIASLTKIMTAIIGIENAELTEEFSISEDAVKIGESSAGLWKDDVIDMKSALYALMVPSGNDAAEAICEFIGKKLIDKKDERIRLKSVEDVENEAAEKEIDIEEVEDVYAANVDQAFTMAMNAKANELGCVNSCFTNAHGLDDEEFSNNNQHSCAADMAKITKYAMQNDLFRKIVSGGDTTIMVKRNSSPVEIKLASTDILIGNYEGCLGVKTGHTDIAGACFSGAAIDQDGTEIYTIVLKSENETERFIDTQKLFDWYFTNKVYFKPALETSTRQTMTINEETKDVGVVANLVHSEWVGCKFPVTTETQDTAIPILSIAGNLHLEVNPAEIKGNFKAGDKVAELILTQHNTEVGKVNLIAVNDQPAPNIFQIVGVAFDRLGKNIANANTVFEHEILVSCDKINSKNNKTN